MMTHDMNQSLDAIVSLDMDLHSLTFGGFFSIVLVHHVSIIRNQPNVTTTIIRSKYLEAQNNQKQPEITKHKPLIINIF